MRERTPLPAPRRGGGLCLLLITNPKGRRHKWSAFGGIARRHRGRAETETQALRVGRWDTFVLARTWGGPGRYAYGGALRVRAQAGTRAPRVRAGRGTPRALPATRGRGRFALPGTHQHRVLHTRSSPGSKTAVTGESDSWRKDARRSRVGSTDVETWSERGGEGTLHPRQRLPSLTLHRVSGETSTDTKLEYSEGSCRRTYATFWSTNSGRRSHVEKNEGRGVRETERGDTATRVRGEAVYGHVGLCVDEEDRRGHMVEGEGYTI